MQAVDGDRDCVPISVKARQVHAPEEVDAAQVRSSMSVDRENSFPPSADISYCRLEAVAAGSLLHVDDEVGVHGGV